MAVTKKYVGFWHGAEVQVFQIDVDFGSIATVTTGTVDVTVTGLTTSDKVVSVCYEGVGNDDVLYLPVVNIPAADTLRFRAYNPTAGALDPTSQVAIVTIAKQS